VEQRGAMALIPRFVLGALPSSLAAMLLPLSEVHAQGTEQAEQRRRLLVAGSEWTVTTGKGTAGPLARLTRAGAGALLVPGRWIQRLWWLARKGA
jgi:hypothetical protein